MDGMKERPPMNNVSDTKGSVLPWSFMFLVLSLVEGALGRNNSAEAFSTISKISLILAMSLLFYHTRNAEKSSTND